MQEDEKIAKQLPATSRFSRRGFLPLAIGVLAGAGVVALISKFQDRKESMNPSKAVDEKAHRGLLLTRLSQLAENHNWRTQADFEKRFEGDEIVHLSPGSPVFGIPLLSFENEKYLVVVLWKEPAVFARPAPIPEPKDWSDPNFRIVRNADGSARRNADGSIRLEATFKDRETVTWSPRRNEDGSYSLKEDVRMPAERIWYLLSAFKKSDNKRSWWGVFVEDR